MILITSDQYKNSTLIGKTESNARYQTTWFRLLNAKKY